MKPQSNRIPSAARMSKLHAAALIMNAAHNADALSTAADTVAAIGNPPDALAVIPPRARVGLATAYAVFASSVSDAFRLDGQPLNGNPVPRYRDAATFEPVTLTAADSVRLYARARALLTLPESCYPDIDAAVVHYLSNRATATRPEPGYFAENHVSNLDRLAYVTRAAERLVYTAARIAAGKRRTFAFSGGYNGRAATELRRLSILASLDAI